MAVRWLRVPRASAHTAIAFAVEAGAHTSSIKERMRHASTQTTTMDPYGLFPATGEANAELSDGDLARLSQPRSGPGRPCV